MQTQPQPTGSTNIATFNHLCGCTKTGVAAIKPRDLADNGWCLSVPVLPPADVLLESRAPRSGLPFLPPAMNEDLNDLEKQEFKAKSDRITIQLSCNI